MYQCGHRRGLIVAAWPGDWFQIGYALDAAYDTQPAEFTIFRKIGAWRLYTDERLSLSPEEARLWQSEIDQLQGYLAGREDMVWAAQSGWEEYWKTASLMYGGIEETLENALAVCRASAETGNPVEFFW
ncbi:MAG: hypothetical protein ACKV2V_13620 [Blastocatellia bacterium]